MQQLGHTRGAHRPDHLLHTPDTFIPAPLPGMRNATAVVHIGPAAGAKFTQYTAILEAGGEVGPAAMQRFVYVLAGEIELDGESLQPDGYAYLPPAHPASIRATTVARLAVIEKPYQPLDGIAPSAPLFGNERSLAPQPVLGDEALQVRTLLPPEAAFDFAMNTLTYQPGASLPMVEIHIMEHGLLMLEGGGIYRLGDRWYPVTRGDFIWMAPYCPQWFGALGKQPSRYLIYKDWNR
jgi:(S)-ureidoglycine aminohydrolase